MLATSSADITTPARSAAEHDRLVAALAARHPVLAAEGFEHHLFRTGDSVLKVYRWFRSRGLSLEGELALRDQQRALHEIYAPLLEARVVALDREGAPCAGERASCHALSMRLADQLPAEAWERRTEAAGWSRRAGIALAACHRRAESVSLGSSDAAGALEKLLVDAARVHDRERRRFPVGRPLTDLVRARAGHLARRTRAAAGRQVPLCHGDLNIGNLVVSAGEVQFIDAGLAMPAGVGLEVAIPFDAGWDVALLGQSIALFGGQPAAHRFARSYAEAAGVAPVALGDDLLYWRALALLLTLAATMRYSAEILDPGRPFPPRRRPGFRLETYVGWLVSSLSIVLAASHADAAANWTGWPVTQPTAARHTEG
jgi:hypothetical protein